jgi:hypothetical protein
MMPPQNMNGGWGEQAQSAGMPGMMPPQNMPMMPGGPMQAGMYSAPAQPFAFGPMAVVPQPAGPAPVAPSPPAETPQQAPAAAPQNEVSSSRFNLGFDPHAREALPFDIPGQNEAGAGERGTAPFTPAPLPPPSFAADTSPAAPFLPVAGGEDFLRSAPPAAEEPPAPRVPPKVLHIRCPAGHLVKARSDLLGKMGRCPACKKTFELRYEDSVEFQRRTEKILQREEIKSGKIWIAWAFLAAFLVFVGLAGLMLFLSH